MASGSAGLYVNPNTGAAQAGLAQFRNAIINGDMRINQRGTSTNLASMTAVGANFGYVCDRWGVFRSGYATGAQMAQGTGLGSSDLPFTEAGITTFARVGRINTTSGTSPIVYSYGLESIDSKKFMGKAVTLSGYYRTGANFSGTGLYTGLYSGTGTDEGMQRGSTITGVASYAPVNLNMPLLTWSKFTFTVTLNSNINQVGVEIKYTPVGTALAADYFDITGVQLELGSVATPFEVRPYPVELQLCQRYFMSDQIFYRTNNTNSTISTTVTINVPFRVVMRSNPTVSVVYDISDGASQNATTGGTTGGFNIVIGGVSPLGFLDLNSWSANAEL